MRSGRWSSTKTETPCTWAALADHPRSGISVPPITLVGVNSGGAATDAPFTEVFSVASCMLELRQDDAAWEIEQFAWGTEWPCRGSPAGGEPRGSTFTETPQAGQQLTRAAGSTSRTLPSSGAFAGVWIPMPAP